jgi:hypothetical protein
MNVALNLVSTPVLASGATSTEAGNPMGAKASTNNHLVRAFIRREGITGLFFVILELMRINNWYSARWHTYAQCALQHSRAQIRDPAQSQVERALTRGHLPRV